MLSGLSKQYIPIARALAKAERFATVETRLARQVMGASDVAEAEIVLGGVLWLGIWELSWVYCWPLSARLRGHSVSVYF
jgi:hypothetical protein